MVFHVWISHYLNAVIVCVSHNDFFVASCAESVWGIKLTRFVSKAAKLNKHFHLKKYKRVSSVSRECWVSVRWYTSTYIHKHNNTIHKHKYLCTIWRLDKFVLGCGRRHEKQKTTSMSHPVIIDGEKTNLNSQHMLVGAFSCTSKI